MNKRMIFHALFGTLLTQAACLQESEVASSSGDHDEFSELDGETGGGEQADAGSGSGDSDESADPTDGGASSGTTDESSDAGESGGGAGDTGDTDPNEPGDPNADYFGRIVDIDGVDGDVWIHAMPSTQVAEQYPSAAEVLVHLVDGDSLSVVALDWDNVVLDQYSADLSTSPGTFHAAFPTEPTDPTQGIGSTCSPLPSSESPCPPEPCVKGSPTCEAWVETSHFPAEQTLETYAFVSLPLAWDTRYAADGSVEQTIFGTAGDFAAEQADLDRIGAVTVLLADGKEVLDDLNSGAYVPPVATDACNGSKWATTTLAVYTTAVCCSVTAGIVCLACAGAGVKVTQDEDEWVDDNCSPIVPEEWPPTAKP